MVASFAQHLHAGNKGFCSISRWHFLAWTTAPCLRSRRRLRSYQTRSPSRTVMAARAAVHWCEVYSWRLNKSEQSCSVSLCQSVGSCSVCRQCQWSCSVYGQCRTVLFMDRWGAALSVDKMRNLSVCRQCVELLCSWTSEELLCLWAKWGTSVCRQCLELLYLWTMWNCSGYGQSVKLFCL